LFKNEPKQTKNGLKNIKNNQRKLSFQLQFPKQNEKLAPNIK